MRILFAETQVYDLIKQRTQTWLNLEVPTGDRDEPALRKALDSVARPVVLTAER